MDPLLRIKRLVLQGYVRFSDKAQVEMAADDLRPREVIESILNAPGVFKTLRSRSERRRGRREKVYVIKSYSFTGTLVYTKGTIRQEARHEVFYLLISAKLSTDEG
jgi:hypothetical protein